MQRRSRMRFEEIFFILVVHLMFICQFSQIQLQVSKCTCSKKFCVTRVAEGQYRVSRDLFLATLNFFYYFSSSFSVW